MTADVEHRQGCPATGGYGYGVEPCTCGAVADVELLPLPEDYDQNPAGNAEVQDYARANVEASTEALRERVSRLDEVNLELGRQLVEHEDRAERLAEALRALLPFVATQAVGCHGDKCRESWCYSCNGEEEADEAAERGREAYHAAHALLRAQEGSHE